MKRNHLKWANLVSLIINLARKLNWAPLSSYNNVCFLPFFLSRLSFRVQTLWPFFGRLEFSLSVVLIVGLAEILAAQLKVRIKNVRWWADKSATEHSWKFPKRTEKGLSSELTAFSCEMPALALNWKKWCCDLCRTKYFVLSRRKSQSGTFP